MVEGVVLDDRASASDDTLASHFVQTESDSGLTEADALAADESQVDRGIANGGDSNSRSWYRDKLLVDVARCRMKTLWQEEGRAVDEAVHAHATDRCASPWCAQRLSTR